MEEWSDMFGFLGGSSINRESAMKLTAVAGCVSLLAGTTATLPVSVEMKDRQKGSSTLIDHRVHWLVNQEPHVLFSTVEFFESLFALAFLEGNSYALIQRNNSGHAIGLLPFIEASVRPFMRGSKLAYSVTENGVTKGYEASDILHFKTSATLKNMCALSPLECFGRAMGIGLQADEYADLFYKQGISPKGYISYEGDPGENFDPEEIRKFWAEKFGSVKNSHLPAVLLNGGKFTSLMTDPETAQLFESRSFQVLDIARAFGVPPHLIGETEKSTSWGTGINAQTGQFYILGLRKHIKRFEAELTRKLLSREERLGNISIKFNLDTLLRADLAARYDAHKIAVGGTQHPGWLTVNEIREIENKPRLDDPKADELFRPVSKAGPEETPSGDEKKLANGQKPKD